MSAGPIASRLVRLGFAAACAVVAATSSAAGQGWGWSWEPGPGFGKAPWCADMGYTLDCSYYTLQQCMARASGVSNNCMVNRWYRPPPPPPARQRRAPRQ